MTDKKQIPEPRPEPAEWTSELMDEYADVEADGVEGLKELGLIIEA